MKNSVKVSKKVYIIRSCRKESNSAKENNFKLS